MEVAITIFLIIVNPLICRRLAHWSTVPFGPLFPFKPFNCAACLTFWFTLASSLGWSWVLSRDEIFLLAVLSVLVSFINFKYYKSKFKIHG